MYVCSALDRAGVHAVDEVFLQERIDTEDWDQCHDHRRHLECLRGDLAGNNQSCITETMQRFCRTAGKQQFTDDILYSSQILVTYV